MATPSASEMPDVKAVRVSPTCAVPLMVGAPAAAEFSGGPGTTNSKPPDSFLPSLVQMAPSAEQSVVAFTAMVTSASESGSTVISHLTFLPASSLRTLSIDPPVTVKAWSRTVV